MMITFLELLDRSSSSKLLAGSALRLRGVIALEVIDLEVIASISSKSPSSTAYNMYS